MEHFNDAMTFILTTSGCSEEFLQSLIYNLPPPQVSFLVSKNKKQELRHLLLLGMNKPDALRWVSGHHYATFLYNKFVSNPQLFASTHLF